MAVIPLYGDLASQLGRESSISRVAQSHPGLALDRYLAFQVNRNSWKFNSEEKRTLFLEFARVANEFYSSSDSPWREWSQRQKDLAISWDDAGKTTRVFTARPRWRWISGLGNETILETGITLHHVYGVPYFPGSALKGLTDAYVSKGLASQTILQKLEAMPDHKLLSNANGTSVQEKWLRLLFGQESRDDKKSMSGEIVFMDAVLACAETNAPRLVVDIMTPHFPRYYRGEVNVPLEEEDPTPIPFLAVEDGDYAITVAARSRNTPPELVDVAAELCQAALQDMGIGGKTAKGYGYFV